MRSLLRAVELCHGWASGFLLRSLLQTVEGVDIYKDLQGCKLKLQLTAVREYFGK